MRVEKKAVPELFRKVLDGKKTFDVRLADFRCKAGDILVLREWNPKKRKYTGRTLKRKIAYVLKTRDLKYWPKRAIEKYGFQVLGFSTEQKR